MPIEILMPALSPTMTEGNLAKWHKKEGDAVKSGDVLAEIETDKATMEVEAVDEGTLGRILVPEGTQGVAVNQPIALLLEEGEDSGALESGGKAGPAKGGNGAAATAPQPQEAPEAPQPQPQPAEPSAQPPQPQPRPAQDAGNGQGRVFASPLARRMAEQSGLDLARLQGSGPNGRIVKADIESALKSGAGTAPAADAKAERPKPKPT